jgi:cytochrome c peroxidase
LFNRPHALPSCILVGLMLVFGLAGASQADEHGHRTGRHGGAERHGHVDELTAVLNRIGGKAQFTMPASQDLAAIPADPRNPITPAKVRLGRFLFHDTAMATAPKLPGTAGTYSCATCHHAKHGFQAGLAQGIGEGGQGFAHRVVAPGATSALVDVQPVRTPSAMNTAWQRVMLWNGQFGATGPNSGTEAAWTAGTPKATNALGYQGLETQAIAGQGVHRLGLAPAVYRPLFDRAFGDWPVERRYGAEAAGLALAAYERSLMANRAPFQRWLRGDADAMDARQLHGAALFFGKARCVACHTGPALNSESFHALGMPDLAGLGVDVATQPEHRGRGGFTGVASDLFKFKTPQLYNLDDSPFYGHGGSFRSIRAVLEYKNRGVAANARVPASQLSPAFRPLGLSEADIDDLTIFLREALYDPALARYEPRALPSGACPINADPRSRWELGCR